MASESELPKPEEQKEKEEPSPQKGGAKDAKKGKEKPTKGSPRKGIKKKEEEPKQKQLFITLYGEDDTFGPHELSKDEEDTFDLGKIQAFDVSTKMYSCYEIIDPVAYIGDHSLCSTSGAGGGMK